MVPPGRVLQPCVWQQARRQPQFQATPPTRRFWTNQPCGQAIAAPLRRPTDILLATAFPLNLRSRASRLQVRKNLAPTAPGCKASGDLGWLRFRADKAALRTVGQMLTPKLRQASRRPPSSLRSGRSQTPWLLECEI